jgi:hypothetical protein
VIALTKALKEASWVHEGGAAGLVGTRRAFAPIPGWEAADVHRELYREASE